MYLGFPENSDEEGETEYTVFSQSGHELINVDAK